MEKINVSAVPYVTFYFESYDAMWVQVQGMVYIEKGGAAPVPDELAAYNPLVPKASEQVATFIIETDDPDRRQRIQSTLGGIEETAFLLVAGEAIEAAAEADQDHTAAEGKTSSVQFVHFPAERFHPDWKSPPCPVIARSVAVPGLDPGKQSLA